MTPADDDATGFALAARDGDPAALAALIRATQTDVWRLCAALVDAAAADDLTQETFLRAIRALPSFAGRSSVRTWLLGIGRRVCADHIRALQRRRRLTTKLTIAEAATRQPDSAQRVELADLLGRISGQRRAAFVLTQVAGLSYAEAAEVENVPVGTIRSRVARARADLLELLDEAAGA